MKPKLLLRVAVSDNRYAPKQLLKLLAGVVTAVIITSYITGCEPKPASAPLRPAQTPLNHLLTDAAWQNDTAGVSAALLKGADPNSVDGRGDTALCYAGAGGEVAMAQLLIKHGANVNFVGSWYGTPLMQAVENADNNFVAHSKLAMVRFLLAHGAMVNVKDGEKRTALFYTCAYRWQDTPIIMRLLIARGAIIHYKDMHGVSPIQEAKKRGYLDFVRLLIQLDKKRYRVLDRKESDAQPILPPSDD